MDDLHKHLYAPFVEHQGTGTIQPEGDTPHVAEFTAGQFPDGDIEVIVTSNLSMRIATGYDGFSQPKKAQIEGETSDGHHFMTEGQCTTKYSFSTEGTTSTTIIDPELMQFTNKIKVSPATIRFGLTSFQFSDLLGFAIDNSKIIIIPIWLGHVALDRQQSRHIVDLWSSSRFVRMLGLLGKLVLATMD